MSVKRDPFIAKVFRLLQVLNLKYGFVLFSGESELFDLGKEYWLINKDDPHYQIIRITYKKAADFKQEENRIKAMIALLSKEVQSDLNSFLDIHVNKDVYDPSFEEYDHINLEYDYADGVDLHEIYPEIYKAISPKEEANNLAFVGKEVAKSRFKNILKRRPTPITYGLIILCILVYLFEIILARRYSEASAYIVLGADYKTFTLGLKQVYRLITCAFLHGSFLHLFMNMYSLYIVGHGVEMISGGKKYVAILFFSILIASLTQEIMTENSVMVGMSGGIYGLFVYFLMFLGQRGQLRWGVLMPTILMNVYLNFLSTTAWLAHIGGAVGGMIMYMVLNSKDNRGPIALLIVVFAFMIWRFATITTINPFYQGTDMEVVNIYSDIGLHNYSVNLMKRLAQVYKMYGG